MNCSACGSVLTDESIFCESCGADLRRSSEVTMPSVIRVRAITAQTDQAVEIPSAAALAQMGGILFKRLSLGEKFSGAGALAGILGFFLPWASGPDLKSLGNLSTLMGNGLGMTSYSAFDFTKIWGGIYLLLCAAIASAVLFFAARKAEFGKKLLISGFQVMIGSLIGPVVVFVLLFVPLMQSVAGLGMWLTGLGFCAISAGGLVTIGNLGRMIR